MYLYLYWYTWQMKHHVNCVLGPYRAHCSAHVLAVQVSAWICCFGNTQKNNSQPGNFLNVHLIDQLCSSRPSLATNWYLQELHTAQCADFKIWCSAQPHHCFAWLVNWSSIIFLLYDFVIIITNIVTLGHISPACMLGLFLFLGFNISIWVRT